MRKHLKKVALIAIGLFLIVGFLMASNMGFKLVYQLQKPAGKSGTNNLALPYNVPFANASELYADIPNCTEVGRIIAADDTLQTYLVGKGAINFPLDPGVGIYVKVSVDGTNYVVVGSHDPSYQVNLRRPAGKSGTNWVSVPYHSTASNASELYDDVPNCNEVGRVLALDDSLQTYLIGKGAINFPIVPGEGVYVKVSADNTLWTPSHY